MSFDFAARVDRVEPSATLAISNTASELEAAGGDLGAPPVGEPALPTPATAAPAGPGARGRLGAQPSDRLAEVAEVGPVVRVDRPPVRPQHVALCLRRDVAGVFDRVGDATEEVADADLRRHRLL